MVNKLVWATDIHLDHAGPDASLAFLGRVRDVGAAAMLLGGDTATALDIDDILVEMADAVGIPVYFVLGNHDYYGGTIAGVRRSISRLKHSNLHWLPRTGPCRLAPGVTLVGHGGWGDARVGDFAGSDVVLSDYLMIAELRSAFNPRTFDGVFGSGSALEAELKRLGRDSADTLTPQLSAAAAVSRQVVVLTHVPPFREACWHEGHTHSGGRTQMARNLEVHTQAADYGAPDFALIEIDAGRIVVGAPRPESSR